MNVARTVRELVMPRRLITLALLVGAWCALWGAVSLPNVLSGVLVAVAVTLAAGLEPGLGRIRLVPLAHFVYLVARDLVVATASVAWEILTPTDYTEEAILAVDTSVESRSHMLLLVVAITVTPGTAVVDVDVDTGRLYLHLLHADRAESTVEHVRKLVALACRALPVDPVTAADAEGVPTGGLP
jgi:multicomponent Na+:H+ antiporter subunit E